MTLLHLPLALAVFENLWRVLCGYNCILALSVPICPWVNTACPFGLLLLVSKNPLLWRVVDGLDLYGAIFVTFLVFECLEDGGGAHNYVVLIYFLYSSPIFLVFITSIYLPLLLVII